MVTAMSEPLDVAGAPVVGGVRQDGRMSEQDPHRPYIAAVAAALESTGLPSSDWYANANDPLDAGIELEPTALAGSRFEGYDDLTLGWTEQSGWSLNVSRGFPPRGRTFWSGMAVLAEPHEVVTWARGMLDGSEALEVRQPHFRDQGAEDGFENALARYGAARAGGVG